MARLEEQVDRFHPATPTPQQALEELISTLKQEENFEAVALANCVQRDAQKISRFTDRTTMAIGAIPTLVWIERVAEFLITNGIDARIDQETLLRESATAVVSFLLTGLGVYGGEVVGKKLENSIIKMAVLAIDEVRKPKQ